MPVPPRSSRRPWAGLTVGEALALLAADFAAAGIDTPRLDARLLIEAATAVTPEALILTPGRPLSAPEAERLRTMADRRIAREPVTRILGARTFYGRTFEVTPATLDPRPDTETLVDLALDLVRATDWGGKPLRILDIGTGTGAILLTLLAEIEGATGLGTDISADALLVAGRNAGALGLSNRVEWLRTRSLEGISGAFDLVVSNPPYIVSADIAGLDPEVARFDPLTALDGGSDGMDVIRDIAAGGAEHTSPAGWVVLEFGAGQQDTVEAIVEKASADGRLPSFRWARDLGGHIRCVAWQPHF